MIFMQVESIPSDLAGMHYSAALGLDVERDGDLRIGSGRSAQGQVEKRLRPALLIVPPSIPPIAAIDFSISRQICGLSR
jgi:hypothetical protein